MRAVVLVLVFLATVWAEVCYFNDDPLPASAAGYKFFSSNGISDSGLTTNRMRYSDYVVVRSVIQSEEADFEMRYRDNFNDGGNRLDFPQEDIFGMVLFLSISQVYILPIEPGSTILRASQTYRARIGMNEQSISQYFLCIWLRSTTVNLTATDSGIVCNSKNDCSDLFDVRTNSTVSFDLNLPDFDRGYYVPDQPRTPDIASVLQEVIDRSSWSSLRKLTLFWSYVGDCTSSCAFEIHTFDGTSGGSNHEITIAYLPPPPNFMEWSLPSQVLQDNSLPPGFGATYSFADTFHVDDLELPGLSFSSVIVDDKMYIYGGYFDLGGDLIRIYNSLRYIDLDIGSLMLDHASVRVEEVYPSSHYLVGNSLHYFNNTFHLFGGISFPYADSLVPEGILTDSIWTLEESTLIGIDTFGLHPYNMFAGSGTWEWEDGGTWVFASFDTDQIHTVYELGYRVRISNPVSVVRMILLESQGGTEEDKRLNIGLDYSYAHKYYVPGEVIGWTKPTDITILEDETYDCVLPLDFDYFPDGVSLEPNRRYFVGFIASIDYQYLEVKATDANCYSNLECYDFFWKFKQQWSMGTIHQDYGIWIGDPNPFNFVWRDRSVSSATTGTTVDIRFDNTTCYIDGLDCRGTDYSRMYRDPILVDPYGHMDMNGTKNYIEIRSPGQNSYWYFEGGTNTNNNPQSPSSRNAPYLNGDNLIVMAWVWFDTTIPDTDEHFAVHQGSSNSGSNLVFGLSCELNGARDKIKFKARARDNSTGYDAREDFSVFTHGNRWINMGMRIADFGNTIYLYLNFTEVKTRTMSHDFKGSTSYDMRIGSSQSTSYQWFGKIGRVLVKNCNLGSSCPSSDITGAAGSGPWDYTAFRSGYTQNMPYAWVNVGTPSKFTEYPSPPGTIHRAFHTSTSMSPSNGRTGDYLIGGLGTPEVSVLFSNLSQSVIFTDPRLDRYDHAVSVFDPDTLAIFGGYTSQSTSDFFLLNVVTLTLQEIASSTSVVGSVLPFERSLFSMVTMSDPFGCKSFKAIGGLDIDSFVMTNIQIIQLIPEIHNITEVSPGLCSRNALNTGLSYCPPAFSPYLVDVHGVGFDLGGTVSVLFGTVSMPIVSSSQHLLRVSIDQPLYGMFDVSVTNCHSHSGKMDNAYHTLFSIIDPFSSQIDNGPVGTTHTLPDTKSPHYLDFDVSGVFDISNVTVTLILDLYESVDCPVVVSNSSTTHIQCIIPPLIGSDVTWYFSETVGGSLAVSDFSTDSFSSPVPVFLGTTIKFRNSSDLFQCSNLPGTCDHLVAESSIQLTVEFEVVHLGLDHERISVSFGPDDKFNCQLSPALMDLSNNDKIYCDTSIGNGQNLTFAVRVGDVLAEHPSNSSLHFSGFKFSFPITPEITSVSGCTDIGLVTTDCDTVGRSPLTLFGQYFDSGSTLYIEVDGKKCNNAVYDNVTSSATCILPEGTGYNKSVVVSTINSQGGVLVGDGFVGVSYGAANITSIDGCMGMDEDGWAYGCNRTSNEVITLHGYNFGASSAVVLVGGSICTNPVHTEGNEHFEVSCILPYGRGIPSVALSQQYGGLSSGGARISYQACEPGYGEPTNGSVICQECDVGKASLVGLVCDICTNGKFSSTTGAAECDNCAVGKYSFYVGLPMDSCAQCPKGKFASTSGSDQCQLCPIGSYSDISGSTECSPCDLGYYQPLSGSTECVACVPGTFSDYYGADVCTDCKPGKFQAVNGSSSCTSCPIGQFSGISGRLNCTDCGSGQYQPLQGQDTCLPCPRGKFQTLNGSSICDECPIGKYQPDSGQTNCLDCNPGTFSDVTGSYICDECPSGKYQNQSSSSGCLTCTPGTFTESSGSSECITCAPGSFQDDNSNNCVLCEPGTFQPNFGGTECEPCGFGKFSAEEGASSCDECGIGEYVNFYGADKCRKCRKGTFSTAIGRTTECDPCPIETYQPNEGQTSCYECTGGVLSEEYGRFRCDRCPLDEYVPTVYVNNSWKVVGTECIECPPGVDCSIAEGFVFAQEGWWFSIDQNEASETYGHVQTFKCLPGRCFDAFSCYEMDQMDPLPTNPNITISATQSTTPQISTTTSNPSTSGIFGSSMIMTTSATPTQIVESFDVTPGLSISCCGLKSKVLSGDIVESARGSFISNPLCGACAEGFYEWGSECVECDGVNWGAVFGLFLITWGMLIVFHYLSQITRAEIKIFFYFIQMVLLFFDSNTPWIRWLSFLSFDAVDSINGVCLAPMDPKDKLMISLWIPFVALLELAFTTLLGYIYWVLYHGGHTSRWDQYKFRKSPYIRTAVALFLFLYYNITITVFEFFKCRDTGNGVRVVETYPGLVCGSEVYIKMKPIIITFLILATILSPFLIWGFLYYHKNDLSSRKFLERYGTLYETYSKSSYYWEFVCLFRRTLLIAFAVSLSENDYSVRMVVLSLTNLAILMMHLYVGPFARRFDNALETFSLAILLFISVRLINVDLPLSANMSVLFIFLVMSPLALFFVLYFSLRVFAYGYPDEYDELMMSEMMSLKESFMLSGSRSSSVVIPDENAQAAYTYEEESISSIDEYLELDPW